MEDNILIQSEKIKLKKLFLICWSVLTAILIAIFIFSITQYIHYKKCQNLIVDTTLAANYISENDKYDNYKNNRTKLIKEMYDYYDERNYDSPELVELIREQNDVLDDILENEGYDEGYVALHYLKYTNFVAYIINFGSDPYIIFVCLTILMLIVNCIYLRLEKVMITIKEKSVICNKTNKKSKEFLIKDIKSIESTWLKGLKIQGNGINLKIHLVKNADEIKMLLMDMLKSF